MCLPSIRLWWPGCAWDDVGCPSAVLAKAGGLAHWWLIRWLVCCYRLPIAKVGPLAHPVRSHTLAHRVQNNSKHTPMGPSWRKKGRQRKHKHKANNHILSVLYVAEHVARSVTDTIGRLVGVVSMCCMGDVCGVDAKGARCWPVCSVRCRVHGGGA
jgi:hypothetical protein